MLERGLRALAAVLAVAGTVSGCGSGAGAGAVASPASTSTAAATAAGRSAASTSATTSASSPTTGAAPRPALAAVLVPGRELSLPAARGGAATTAFHGRAIVAGGLSGADVSTDTVFELSPGDIVTSLHPLPSAIHDAAAATLGNRLLVFGGGVAEGSDHIVQVFPGPSRQVGTLPQALSDLVAAQIGGVAYIAGGWNGTETNRTIYAVTSRAQVRRAGTLPLGVRYPAAGALGGRLIIAGGEVTSGAPTGDAWSFDPVTGAVTRLPRLPAPTDHAAATTFGGRFYVIGGLRRGTLTQTIVSWAPGEARWRRAGRLAVALADASAVPFGTGVALIGGRAASGRVRTITLFEAR